MKPSTSNHRRPFIIGTLMILILLLTGSAGAGVYRYQDENGNWHFSDRPVEGMADSQSQTEPGIAPSHGQDLAQRLSDMFAPKNDIERVSIATVAIQTAAGYGSRFFITDDGYILTNRHVLQGDKTQKQAIEKQYLNYKRQVESLKYWIEGQKGRIKIAEAQLQAAKEDIDRERNLRIREGKQQIYEAQLNQFEQWQANVRSKEYELSEFERKLDSAKLALDQRDLVADLSQNFTIFLRDRTELYVYLVAASDTYDLALLKLDGYTTPHIKPFNSFQIAQGESVYAVGNPLNLRTQVAAGVLSGHQGAFVKTDARIYPGNSGGPLVTESGRVIGINTFKQLTRNFEGLGFAIRIDIVLNEFSGYLNPWTLCATLSHQDAHPTFSLVFFPADKHPITLTSEELNSGVRHIRRIAAQVFQGDGQIFHFLENFSDAFLSLGALKIQKETVIAGIRSQRHGCNSRQIDVGIGKEAQHPIQTAGFMGCGKDDGCLVSGTFVGLPSQQQKPGCIGRTVLNPFFDDFQVIELGT